MNRRPMRLFIAVGTGSDPLCARLAGDEGIVAERGESAAETLRAVQRGDYDVVVIGPRVAASERDMLCRELRRASPSPPVLAITADSISSERVAALDAGADDCVSEPLEVVELLARLEALVRRSR